MLREPNNTCHISKLLNKYYYYLFIIHPQIPYRLTVLKKIIDYALYLQTAQEK